MSSKQEWSCFNNFGLVVNLGGSKKLWTPLRPKINLDPTKGEGGGQINVTYFQQKKSIQLDLL